MTNQSDRPHPDKMRAYEWLYWAFVDAKMEREAAGMRDALRSFDAAWEQYHAQVKIRLDERAELTRLRSQLAAAEEDARRYRWLREQSARRPLDFYSNEAEWMVSRQQGGFGQNFFGEKIDAAIDAAMTPTEEKR